MPLPDQTRRTPGGAPGSGKLSDETSTSILPQASDRWRFKIDHAIDQLTKICPLCQTQLADPEIGECLGCREIGAGDVFSPRQVAS